MRYGVEKFQKKRKFMSKVLLQIRGIIMYYIQYIVE